MDAQSLRRQLLLSSAVLVGALSAYGRRAYAACVGGPTVFVCSGATASTTINATNAQVSTLPGFSIVTASPTALTIIGDGVLSYTDLYASGLTGATTGLSIGSLGSGTDSVTVNASGDIKGGSFGISARNTVGGTALTITAAGNVTGTNSRGIQALNFGTNLSVATGAGKTVIGSSYGIFARNYGTGTTAVTVNGDVTALGAVGNAAVLARSSGTDLTVTTAAGTTLRARRYGIFARGDGTGALTITTNGSVRAYSGVGIFARNSGTDLTITTSASTYGVTGGTRGIYARNFGSGALSITANGDVTGTSFSGIDAQNSFGAGTDLTITTGARTTITGGFLGIRAFNYGSGALAVAANGDVTAPTTGITALNYSGTNLTVTTGAGTTISGGSMGLSAINYGSGALTITVNGDVAGGTDDGIYVCHGISFLTCGAGGGPITITVGTTSHVTSSGTGADDFAVDINGDPADITVVGTLNGGAGGAIQFDQGAALDDRLNLETTAVINGKVLGGPGNDTVAFEGSGASSFDVSQLVSFETGEKTGSSVWTLTGTNTEITNFAVNGGILSVDGSMPNAAFTVNSGTLGGTGIVGPTTVADGATLAPGNSIGTFTVKGNLTLHPGAIYEVETNAAGQSDKVIVEGTVNLTGSVLRVLAEAGSYKPKTEYLIIDNDGGDAVIGKFAQITASLAFLTPVVVYNGGDGNDVMLTLLTKCPIPPSPPNPPKPPSPDRGGPLATFCSAARTHNQRAVAKALSLFPTDNPLFLAVLNLPSADSARQAFDALSGEIHATLPGVLADESRYVREAILGRLTQTTYTNSTGQVASLGVGGPQVVSLDSQAMALSYDDKSFSSAPPAYGPGIAFWTNAYGAWGNFDGNRNAATADRNLRGFVSGMDAHVTSSWRLGVATGFSQSTISVDKRHSTADVQGIDLAGYAGGMAGPLALRGGGVWAWQDIDTSRAVTFPGFFEREKAYYDANTGQVFGEAAYPTSIGSIALEPFADLAHVQVSTSSFKEHGGELSALRGRDNDENVGYSTLGLRFGTIWHWNEMVLVPHASAAWQHAFNDVTPGAALAFASTSIGLDITGVPLAENSLLVEAGLDYNVSPTALLGVSYSGQLASDLVDNSVKGRFTWVF